MIDEKQRKSIRKHGSVLIIGGGISGVQSALDLADAGFKVYIVERSTSIGGTMAQLDKTFPTNDCAMCILAPKLVYTGRHQNIEIITNAEVSKVEGSVGNFSVTVVKHPRYVDLEKCNGCGDCVEHCPVEIKSIFDEGLSSKKAIYQLFPQAIPNSFAILKHEGVSPCKLACPAGLNVQGFIALVSQKKFAEAFELITEKLPLPSILGRICYHPCERECNRKDIDESVSICHIHRFVADYIYNNPSILEEYKIQLEKKIEDKCKIVSSFKKGRGQKIAIIGSGPAGITAAYDLASMGYKPTIFEAESYIGGMLYHGIPDYRLPKEYLTKEIEFLLSRKNIEIKTNQRFGKDFNLSDLRRQGFKAIFIAIGANKSQLLDIKCCKEGLVIDALTYLKEFNTGKLPKNYLKEKKVVVVGGGNVAIDAARTALRQGGDVTILYRRTMKEMPAHPEEISQAEEEGVKFVFLTNPVELVKRQRGKETILKCIKMKLGEPDETGRRRPIPIENSEFDIECDILITAVGQKIETEPLHKNGIDLTSDGLIKVDPISLQTSQKDVFAGGDCVSGPASAVEAIKAGHEAAISIDRFLNIENLIDGREKKDTKKASIPNEAPRYPLRREVPRYINVEERIKSFVEIDKGLSFEQVIREAKRCLNCAGCCECLQCVRYCTREAIDHQMKEESIELKVGSIIVSPGFDEYKPPSGDSYGYMIYPNVVTSIEFERMLSASGPFKGHIQRLSDSKPPRKIAWLQCVGSRDESCDRKYCSSVCCMYATKEAVIAKEHQPGIETHIYYMDMRSFGKDFERYFKRAAEEYGVVYRRCRIPQIEQIRQTKNLLIRYVDEKGNLRYEEYDMVVLSVGLQPCSALKNISQILNLNLNEYGFIETDVYNPVSTSVPGIYASGTATEPKDVPESVTQASAAASEVAKDIHEARGTEVVIKKYPPEIDIKNDSPRIGVFVCHCGINIGSVIDVKKVVEYAKKLPYVVYADDATFTCSQDSLEKIKEKIKELKLNRIVVASCTPRTHEPLFQDTLREAGLNPYLFEMANLRDQNSWVHRDDPVAATEKAIDTIRMAIAKASNLYPINNLRFKVIPKALVIGGGIAGMTAALSLADQGYETILVEKEPTLGGHLRDIYIGVRGENPQELLRETIKKVNEHKNIHVFTDTLIKEISGYVGNFKTTLISNNKKSTVEVEHGVIIVATGGSTYEPTSKDYCYGKSKDIITQTEFEKEIFDNNPELKSINELVMIQCVGSRNEEHPYCSRVCCSEAIKNALRFKEINPDASVYILYRDIRTYGFREDLLYRKARQKGIIFIRFEENDEPKVHVRNGKIEVIVKDYIIDREIQMNPDKLVLSVGIVPRDNIYLAQQLKIPLNQDGFYSEAHIKLRPVDFSTDGIYLCGLAHSPRFLDESILQAKAAAARAATILSKDYLETKCNIAYIRNRNCVGCKLCIEVCPYDAISFEEERGIAVINEILCQGCGACSAVCPNGTCQQNMFNKKQILSMIDACIWRE